MSEKEQTNEEQQLIDEMIRDAEATSEPGTMKRSDVIHRSDEEVPSPMITSALESAGYVYIYDRKTGERSVCNKNMLSQHLKKKRNGEYVFTTKKMSPPAKGTHKCMLHPDDPNREHYDQLGLPVCRKANLASPFQVKRHMQKRHKQEWATIESEKQEAKEQRDREFQESLLTKVSGNSVGTPEAPLYVSDKDKRGPGRPRKEK